MPLFKYLRAHDRAAISNDVANDAIKPILANGQKLHVFQTGASNCWCETFVSLLPSAM